MVKRGVLFEVQTEFLNNIYMNVGFKRSNDAMVILTSQVHMAILALQMTGN
jgi:hypothetical protein